MTIEWVIGIATLAGLAGIGLGWLLALRVTRKAAATAEARAEEVETQLEQSQQELEDYRREVYGQFAQTADRFKQLDESYHALHQQLASSAVALCGEQAGPLLAAPERGAIIAEEVSAETVVHDVAVAAGAPDEGDTEASAEVPETPVDGDGAVEGAEVTEEASADDEIPTITDVLGEASPDDADPTSSTGEAAARVAEVETATSPAATGDGTDPDGLKRTA